MSEEANNFASSAIGEQGELKFDLTDICAKVKNIEDFDNWFEGMCNFSVNLCIFMIDYFRNSIGWVKFCKQKNVQQLHINPTINNLNATLPEFQKLVQKIGAIAQKLVNVNIVFFLHSFQLIFSVQNIIIFIVHNHSRKRDSNAAMNKDNRC